MTSCGTLWGISVKSVLTEITSACHWVVGKAGPKYRCDLVHILPTDNSVKKFRDRQFQKVPTEVKCVIRWHQPRLFTTNIYNIYSRAWGGWGWSDMHSGWMTYPSYFQTLVPGSSDLTTAMMRGEPWLIFSLLHEPLFSLPKSLPSLLILSRFLQGHQLLWAPSLCTNSWSLG